MTAPVTRPPNDPYFAPLPPITPASYGHDRAPALAARRRRTRSWLPSWRAVRRWLPVSFVVLLILLPYLPFTLLLALRTTSTRRGRPYLALYQLAAFHTLLGLALWALAVVVLTPAGSPADAPGSPEAEEEGYELVRREDAGEGGPGGQVMAKASTGGQRWCKRCAAPKPDRCHHCSSCGTCILKMDHHCLWLGTCVGFANYRAFLLFVSYTALLALFVAVEAGRTVWGYFAEDSLDAVDDLTPIALGLLILDGLAFGLSLGGFAAWHWYLALTNQTTLETLSHASSPPSLALPPSVSHAAAPTALRWRPDHLLTPSERRRARAEEKINVWDVGYRRNLRALAPAGSGRAEGWRGVGGFLKPGRVGGEGRVWAVDEEKVERLRERTRRVRLGEGEGEEGDWGVRSLASSSVEESTDDDGDDDGDEEDEERGLVGRRRPRAPGRGKGWDTRTTRAAGGG